MQPHHRTRAMVAQTLDLDEVNQAFKALEIEAQAHKTKIRTPQSCPAPPGSAATTYELLQSVACLLTVPHSILN